MTATKLPSRDIFYFRQRYKGRIFEAVCAYFAKQAEAGLTKADISEKLGVEIAQATEWLSGPGGWTLDTVSDILLAMDAEMSDAVISFDK